MSTISYLRIILVVVITSLCALPAKADPEPITAGVHNDLILYTGHSYYLEGNVILHGDYFIVQHGTSLNGAGNSMTTVCVK